MHKTRGPNSRNQDTYMCTCSSSKISSFHHQKVRLSAQTVARFVVKMTLLGFSVHESCGTWCDLVCAEVTSLSDIPDMVSRSYIGV